MSLQARGEPFFLPSFIIYLRTSAPRYLTRFKENPLGGLQDPRSSEPWFLARSFHIGQNN